MSWGVATAVGGSVVGVMIFLGVGIGTAMGIVGIVGLTAMSGTSLWPSLGDVVFNTLTSFTLVSVPLFLLMSEIILFSGVSQRFYSGISALLAPVPGALAYSNIIGCAMFSAVCGSSVATAITVGAVALPEMRQRKYNDRITVGTLTAGGCLGILIPPSIPMVVYGSVTNESVIDMFVAGVVPGIALAGCFLLYVAVWSMFNRDKLPPRETTRLTLRAGTKALVDCVPITALILFIFFSMYFGLVTPTEASALGCLASILLATCYRQFSWKMLWAASQRTVIATAVIMFIVINAQFLSFTIVQAGIGKALSQAIVDSHVGPFGFFCLLFIVFLVLGMFVDGLSMMLLTVPILYGPMVAMGFNGIWIGVVMIMLIELGALTPPMGLNLFAIQSISPGLTLSEASKASLPFALIIGGFVFLMFFFPQIALFLPQLMKS